LTERFIDGVLSVLRGTGEETDGSRKMADDLRALTAAWEIVADRGLFVIE